MGKLSSDQQQTSKVSSDQQQTSKILSDQQQTSKLSFDQQQKSKLSSDQQQESKLSSSQQQKSKLSSDQQQKAKLSSDQQQTSSKLSFDQAPISKISCPSTSNSIIESRISSSNNNEVIFKPKHVLADDIASEDKNDTHNEGDEEQVTNSSVCPEGIDQDVFNQLPEDIKLEISQSMKLKKNHNSNSIISNQINQKSNSKSKGSKKKINPK